MTTRTFPPGSRWADFKLYCDETTADRLVPGAIAPLADELEREGVIASWFFVRAADPSHHLRVRFDLAGGDGWATVSARVHELAGTVLPGKALPGKAPPRKAQPETYERELERYGLPTIELSERIFHRDSQMAARAIALVQEAGNEDLRWQFGLLAMMRILDDFALSLSEQLRLLEAVRQRLLKRLLAEDGASKTLAGQITRQYREKREAIEQVLDPARHPFEPWVRFVELLEMRAHATALERFELLSLARGGRLTVPLGALHAGYLHTFCNRLFASGQRRHELTLVTFLNKHVDARLAKLRE